MDRLGEIRERAEKLKVSSHMLINAGHVSSDYTYLLERIDELEQRARIRETDCATAEAYANDLERENERLRRMTPHRPQAVSTQPEVPKGFRITGENHE